MSVVWLAVYHPALQVSLWNQFGLAQGYPEVNVTRPDGAVEKHYLHVLTDLGAGVLIDHLAGRERQLLVWQGSRELAKATANWGRVSTYLPQHDYGEVAEAFKPRWVCVESGENYRDGQHIPDQPCLEYEVATWETDGNAAKATVNWRFTTADARIKLKRRLPIN